MASNYDAFDVFSAQSQQQSPAPGFQLLHMDQHNAAETNFNQVNYMDDRLQVANVQVNVYPGTTDQLMGPQHNPDGTFGGGGTLPLGFAVSPDGGHPTAGPGIGTFTPQQAITTGLDLPPAGQAGTGFSPVPPWNMHSHGNVPGGGSGGLVQPNLGLPISGLSADN